MYFFNPPIPGETNADSLKNWSSGSKENSSLALSSASRQNLLILFIQFNELVVSRLPFFDIHETQGVPSLIDHRRYWQATLSLLADGHGSLAVLLIGFRWNPLTSAAIMNHGSRSFDYRFLFVIDRDCPLHKRIVTIQPYITNINQQRTMDRCFLLLPWFWFNDHFFGRLHKAPYAAEVWKGTSDHHWLWLGL